MKTPLHYQTTIADCAPVSLVNALSVLFHREDIPPAVVHRIHTVSYDLIGKNNQLGLGTSGMALEQLGHFIENYRTDTFKVRHKCLYGEALHLGENNPVDECLAKGGVFIASIRLFRWWHCVLILGADETHVFIHDPYRRVRQQKTYGGSVVLLESDGFGPNLRVTREWFDQTRPLGRFCFGPMKDRGALALWRIQ